MDAHAQRTAVSSTQRTADVLLAFAGGDRWLGVSEIGRRVGLSKAVVHRILQTLVTTGLITVDQPNHLYALGSAAITLGRKAERDSFILRAAEPYLSHLAQATGETVTVSARIGHERTYVAQLESAQSIRIKVDLGQRLPLTLGSSGLCMLAFLPAREIDLILERPLTPSTPRTLVDPTGIRQRLAAIRESGWASTEGERLWMSSGTAAPILDDQGSPVGALSVAYLDSRLASGDRGKLAAQVVEFAALASAEYRRLVDGAR